MHYYTRNLGDYAKKAGRLTMLQHGAYTLLLDSCYDREEFPTEEQAIEWTWASNPDEVQAVQFVLARFFIKNADGKYIQSRIAEEIEAYRIHGVQNRLIALSREARKNKRNSLAEALDTLRDKIKNAPLIKSHDAWTQDIEALLKTHEASPNQEPITNNQEPITKNQLKDIAETPENLPAIAVAKAPAVQVKKIGFDYTEKKWLGLQDNSSQIKIWAETYPGVDLRAEFLEMKSWLTSNPANRKTNLPKFINNWLKKSQDRASRPENKTFYERTKDQKQADAEKRYEGLLNADHETLVKWGLA